MRNLRLTIDQFNALQPRELRTKYKSKKKNVNGIDFDSTREARRYQDLELMQRAGQITELRRQVPYVIEINGKHICKWIADFVYLKDGIEHVEDSKGFKTPEYRLKRKLVEAIYGFRILET